MAEKNKEYVTLLLDDGNIIEIEFDTDDSDLVHEDLRNHQNQNKYWTPSVFNECTTTWNGIYITEINMKRVVAIV